MEFNTLTRRVAELYEADPAAIEPDARLMPGGEAIAWRRLGGAAAEPASNGAAAPAARGAGPAPSQDGVGTPASLAAKIATEASSQAFDLDAYETITSLERLRAWVGRGARAGLLSPSTRKPPPSTPCRPTSSASPWRWRRTAPPTCRFSTAAIPISSAAACCRGRSRSATPSRRSSPCFADPSVLKIGQNVKFDALVLKRHGVETAPFDDTMLISYVLDAGKGPHGMDELCRRHLGHTPISFEEVTGTGRARLTFDRVDIDKAARYAAEDADVTLRLWHVLRPRLPAERRTSVYETLERPLVDVLARMEERGITIDRQILSRLSGDFAQSLMRLEDEITGIAGEKVALGSPKQIGDILFGKMGLPGAKKTPSGQWATPATLLDELAQAGHELPKKILEWRQLAKLKSTYTDTLQQHMHPQTNRVHTCFALAATTTGRLSSSDPNLQNIPDPHGGRAQNPRRLHRAAGPQDHLRRLQPDRAAGARAYRRHPATAAGLRGRHRHPRGDRLGDVRRAAPGDDMRICAGRRRRSISASSTACRPSASPSASASRTRMRPTSSGSISSASPASANYIEDTKKSTREKGYVTTLFGRVCHYPQIKSGNPSERAGVERQAINAPIQGSAADIIRRAMARMDEALARGAALRPHAAAGARRTRLRGAGRGGRGDAPGHRPGHDRRAVPGGAPQGAPRRRRAGGAELGRGSLVPRHKDFDSLAAG